MFYFTSNYTTEKSKEFLTLAEMIDFIKCMEPDHSYHTLHYDNQSFLMYAYKENDNNITLVIGEFSAKVS